MTNIPFSPFQYLIWLGLQIDVIIDKKLFEVAHSSSDHLLFLTYAQYHSVNYYKDIMCGSNLALLIPLWGPSGFHFPFPIEGAFFTGNITQDFIQVFTCTFYPFIIAMQSPIPRAT